MKSTTVLSLGLTTATLFASSVSAALLMTPVQLGSFESSSDGTYTDLAGASTIVSGESMITGFKKFDSSLGTLSRVLLTFNYTGTTDSFVEIYALGEDIPDGGGFYASYFSDGQVDIIYKANGGPFGFGAVTDSFDLSGGYIDGDVDDYVAFDPGPEEDTLQGADGVGPEMFGPSSVNDSIGPSDGFFVLSDFVGSSSDDVDTLFAGFYTEVNNGFDGDTSLNPATVYVGVDITLDAGTASLQYEYDPAVIPEPSTATALFGLLALGSITARRRR